MIPDSTDSISVDLSVCSEIRGVAEPNYGMGFSMAELERMSFVAGQRSATRVLAISEYNPAIEKFQTGLLLCKLFANFLFGRNSTASA